MEIIFFAKYNNVKNSNTCKSILNLLVINTFYNIDDLWLER